jgi:hypothetical protein
MPAKARLQLRAFAGIFARHENRFDLHYGRDHYPLGIAGGAVFFIPDSLVRRARRAPTTPCADEDPTWLTPPRCGSTTR